MSNLFSRLAALSRTGHPVITRGRRYVLLLVAVAWILGTSAVPVRAQSYLQSIGVPPFSTQLPVQNGYINLANGDLHLEIPLGSFPQRGGRTETVALVYDSNIWWVGGSWSDPWQPTNVNNDGGISGFGNAYASPNGWRVVSSAHGGYVDAGETEDGVVDYQVDYSPWIYVEPNGTVHAFDVYTTYNAWYDTQTSSSGYANDGSGYFMSASGYNATAVYAPDGTLVYGSGFEEDSNGNQYPYDGSGDPIDTLNRTLMSPSYVGGEDAACTGDGTTTCTVTVPNAEGGTSTYTIKFTTIDVHTNFDVNFGYGIYEYSGTINVPNEVDLPDGSAYTFQYDSGSALGHFGQLTQMILPTGGEIDYTYSVEADANYNVNSWIASVKTPDSSTPLTIALTGTYSTQQNQVAVTKPSGDTDVYTFIVNGGAWPIGGPALHGIDLWDSSGYQYNLLELCQSDERKLLVQLTFFLLL